MIPFTSRRAALLTGLLVCAVLGAAGCQPADDSLAEGGGEVIQAPADSISIYQLAGRLAMKVIRASHCSGTLSDGEHTVVVFADPNGQVHLDGRAIGPDGGIAEVRGMLFVSDAHAAPLLRAVRLARAAARPRPQPERPEPRRRPAAKGCIVIDPGHGGKDPGCTSVYGLPEKAVNLPVSLRVSKLLRDRGYKVILTRSDDTFIELNERAAIANRNGADLFLSIHADWAENAGARGSTLYVARAATGDSLSLAAACESRLGGVCSHSRGTRRADFRVLVRTSCPAALIELGFMSNHVEARKLADAAYQDRLADAVAAAAEDFLSSR